MCDELTLCGLYHSADKAMREKGRKGRNVLVKLTPVTGESWFAFLAHDGDAEKLPLDARESGGLLYERGEPHLPGFALAVAENYQSAAVLAGEELSAKMREPGRDISADAGEMERESPLFFGTGDNPALF